MKKEKRERERKRDERKREREENKKNKKIKITKKRKRNKFADFFTCNLILEMWLFSPFPLRGPRRSRQLVLTDGWMGDG